MKDIHPAIIERFIELSSDCVPWQRAENIVSCKVYRGINCLPLGSTQFGSPFWITFRQAHELGEDNFAWTFELPPIDLRLCLHHPPRSLLKKGATLRLGGVNEAMN